MRGLIIQFGPNRSGTTLIYNMLREMFPKAEVQKHHNYFNHNCPTVVTYRHPLDCIASLLMCSGQEPTDTTIDEAVEFFSKHGMPSGVLAANRNPKTLMLKYEKFRYNFDYIFDNIETYFNVVIIKEERTAYSKRYDIDRVKKFIDAMKMKSFAEWDKETGFHGEHISKYHGHRYYYKNFFSPEQINNLGNIYKGYMSEMGYEIK